MTLARTSSRMRSGPARSGLIMAAMLAGVVVLGLPFVGPVRAADPQAATPLTVRLVRLSPATLPTHGKVVLAGTVLNSSAEPWTAVNVYPFTSYTPMTTREEITAAAASDPAQEVGTRLTQAGQFASIGDLAPGQTTAFRIAVPVKDLHISGQDGVYWIGVHALGRNAAGSDSLADGRARTFIPRISSTGARTSVALVVPVRESVRRDPTGRVLSTTQWSDALAPSGRLGRIAGFLSSAGSLSETLVIDPAVLDAVASLSGGNPALSLGTSTGGPSSSPSPTSTATSRSSNRLDPTDRANASAWLVQVIAAARAHSTLGLGYSDPDVSALAKRRPSMLRVADTLASETFTALNIPAVPAVDPPDGWLDDDALSRIQPSSVVIVSDHDAPRTRTRWRTAYHQDLVLADAQAAAGGPGPSAPLDALALRQRIVSDAALRTLDGSTGPLVVALPATWDPGADWQSANFFGGLNLPWLDLVDLNPGSDTGTPIFGAPLGYPPRQRRSEIDNASVLAARTLITTGSALAHLLRTKNTIGHDVPGTALAAVSYHARGNQTGARDEVLATDAGLRATMAKVQVLGTDFVTLSGGSGTLAVTLVNGLDQPITVGIRPHASTADVRIDAVQTVQMAPGQRTVLRLKAHTSAIGVTQVTLTPVTANGATAGAPLTFSLRTSQVGNLIWGVLAAGALLLVVMVAIRIRRAVRENRFARQGSTG